MPKILIVDDSPTQLYHLRKLVENGGHDALTVESGEQALEVAADQRPAVILMDIVMPGMSGYTATRKLGKGPNTSHIPVIFVTSKDTESTAVVGYFLGTFEVFVQYRLQGWFRGGGKILLNKMIPNRVVYIRVSPDLHGDVHDRVAIGSSESPPHLVQDLLGDTEKTTEFVVTDEFLKSLFVCY